MEDERKTIPEMLQEIEKLRTNYGAALDSKLAASRSCTAILNDLNKAQKLLDEEIVNLKKLSPADSYWSAKKRSCDRVSHPQPADKL